MKASFKSAVLLFIALFIFPAVFYGAALDDTKSYTENAAGLKGIISDADGNPVHGGMVFVYNNTDVRRAADFISAPADKDGAFHLVLPPGKYWVIARFKNKDPEKFGPLMPGDKHSGDPVELELAPDSEVNMDFTVADLREAIKMKREAADRPWKITGRILDEHGDPLAGAYVFAYRKEVVSHIPDYMSAWADTQGNYTLYVPEGKFFLGGSEEFPPAKSYFITGEMTIDSDKSNVDIVKKSDRKK